MSPARDTKSARSAVLVMGCTLVSRILGFVRMAVVTAFFGASGQADVLFLTFNIPNNLRKLMAEGALSSAFIPVLSKTWTDDPSGRRADRIVRQLITFQLIVLVPLCGLSILFAEPLVSVILSEFDTAWQVALSTDLFRWFIGYLIFVSVSAVLSGALQVRSRFLIPALTPVLFSVCVISSVLALHNQLGVHSMVVGVLAGGAVQILFQIPAFRRQGYSFGVADFRGDPEFQMVMKQWLPVMATSSVFTVVQMIALRLASGLETGSITWMSQALVFWQLPFGVFSVSIMTVLFPKMSRQAAAEEWADLRESVALGVQGLFALLVPSAMVLILLGRPMISLALQRGAFLSGDTQRTAEVLMYYSLGLFSVGAFNFMQRFFYSVRDFKTPFFVALGTGVLDVVLCLLWKDTALGVSALALANTVSFSLGFLALYTAAGFRLRGVCLRETAVTVVKVIISSVPAYGYMVMLKGWGGDLWLEGLTPLLGLYLVASAGGCAMIGLGMFRLVKLDLPVSFLRRRRG